MTVSTEIDPDNYWVFGYGSLIYKPPPHTLIRVPGYITNVVRRFWQSSNDHRGTPACPGRVVTLIDYDFYASLVERPETDPHYSPRSAKTWGVAYKIDPRHARAVKAYLDFREKNGYSEHRVVMTVHPEFRTLVNSRIKEAPFPITETVVCHVYIGKPDNEAFVGFQDPETLARHIADSRGPSGENSEYLYNLHDSLQNLCKLLDEEELLKASSLQQEVQRLVVQHELDDYEEDVHISDLVARAKLYKSI